MNTMAAAHDNANTMPTATGILPTIIAHGGDREPTLRQVAHLLGAMTSSSAVHSAGAVRSGSHEVAKVAPMPAPATGEERGEMLQHVARPLTLENATRVLARIDTATAFMLRIAQNLRLDFITVQLAIDHWVRVATVDVELDVPAFGICSIMTAVKCTPDRRGVIAAFNRILSAARIQETQRLQRAFDLVIQQPPTHDRFMTVNAYSQALCGRLHIDTGVWADTVCDRARLASLLRITTGRLPVVVAAVAYHVARFVHEYAINQLQPQQVHALANRIEATPAFRLDTFTEMVDAIQLHRALVFHGMDALSADAPAIA